MTIVEIVIDDFGKKKIYKIDKLYLKNLTVSFS